MNNIILDIPLPRNKILSLMLQKLIQKFKNVIPFSKSKYVGISPRTAHTSILQLMQDLAEAVLRSDNPQNFLSTRLFIFWASDDLHLLHRDNFILQYSKKFLKNYIATAILERKYSSL